MQTKKSGEQGYILLYVMLSMTLFAVLATSIVKSTVEDVELGAQELSAVRAQSAADAAVECFSYWARRPEFPFNTNTPAMAFDCDTGANSSNLTSINTGVQTECVPTEETYQLPELANGSCSVVTIQTLPLIVPGVLDPSPLCSVRIKAEGYDDCATKEVSRVRWETIGGWRDAGSTDDWVEAEFKGVAPTLDSASADGHGIDVSIEDYAVLQVEVSGVPSTTHESNTIEIENTYVGAARPLGEVVWYRLYDKTALGSWGVNTIEEFDDGDSTTIFSAFNESTTMRVSVPGDLEEGFYPLAVRVSYGSAVYDDVLVYLNVTNSGRGQE